MTPTVRFIVNLDHIKIIIAFIVLIYVACVLDQYEWVSNQYLNTFIHTEMLTNDESSFFEILSAVAWVIATYLFFNLLRKQVKLEGLGKKAYWFAFYMLLSFFAFGEEISWGDHLFDYSHDLEIIKINAQKETNLHNINLSNLLSLEKDGVMDAYLKNLGNLLTPLFYLVLAFFWVFLPAIKRWISGFSIINAMPSPSTGFMLFFVVHAIMFIFIDYALFNVGQVFEMFISLATIAVALDILKANAQAQAIERENS
ncbi:hypothetical protein [Solemya velum gill symbiont]|uniref:Uncharacterized protein n=2 Tax=Solemya velum gill symbiont TaxID=2340 RepID=A0A1T2FJD7_SOVGS|nr:hypothetical protein [Solemya velum gill symbiont]OOY34566.1 hypothetical protein BOV88_09700 [Solemya velum gill symbiont]OOY37281.1 hypothetical protein BOV89_08540 [Solemya velum gill symbiont]OOY40512.1 hypothetical protein BOV90_03835 [Solemya velum gill symbiont]OOY42614.1 hypothetical protein BOV91_06450 [Solemya velum gill symbiont]OOY45772.1 hypothetical protein BOV92_04440 [Solemya velum gill symbiont]